MKWKKITGWSAYEVSDTGAVRRNGKLLSIFTVKGYSSVNLSDFNRRKSARVHRLVAEAFIDRIDGKTTINHIDGDRSNNKVENLEWCTPSENELHSYRVLKKRHGMTKIEKSEHSSIKNRFFRGESQASLAIEYKVSRQQIWNIIHGYRRKR
jgi:hypothetical protein